MDDGNEVDDGEVDLVSSDEDFERSGYQGLLNYRHLMKYVLMLTTRTLSKSLPVKSGSLGIDVP